ncbi:MAG: type II secretion system GspH family protein [Proteobacteria bacterium]|nr:type II secretion system GspH family protein [Pseudomonadota bacterium]MBU1688074.1 type II secretion system GspH family protein [Pseudomonadota bacterium]
MDRHHPTPSGFTLIELVIVIVLLGSLAVTVAVKWPSGMEEQAATSDVIRAIRFAQHQGMTRQYTASGSAWGFAADGVLHRYTVKRADDSEFADPDYVNHSLPGKTSLSAGTIWFNGLGEPIDTSGTPLGMTTFTVGGTTITIHPETGYVE